jgi:hypothetical protein
MRSLWEVSYRIVGFISLFHCLCLLFCSKILVVPIDVHVTPAIKERIVLKGRVRLELLGLMKPHQQMKRTPQLSAQIEEYVIGGQVYVHV